MTFKDYQEQAAETAFGPATITIVYPALGLAGETGEVVEKVKKLWRDKAILFRHEVDNPPFPLEDDIDQIVLEMGDVLWYLNMLATNLGISMDDVAARNLAKLADRKARKKLKGEGDDR